MSGSVCIGLRRFLFAAGLGSAAWLLGCQTVSSTRVTPTQVSIRQPTQPVKEVSKPPAPAAANSSADESITDPCALRLHDISGQMLWFWAVNHRLPEMLDELRTTADPGTNVDYTCPVTHKQYGYAPGGWQALNQPRRLVVYDSVPNPDGSRWAILIGEPKAAQPLATWVVKLPEMMFRSYLPPVP